VSLSRTLIVCIIIPWMVLLSLGCDGDDGIRGRPGQKGRKGDIGTDPDREALPPPQYVTIGIVNGSMLAVVGSQPVYVTFDSSVHEGEDTVVARRLSIPPLLDGNDGGTDEWGTHRTVIPLQPLRIGSEDTLPSDPRIRRVNCRVGFDDDFIYVLLHWVEATVTVLPQDGSGAMIVAAGESKDENTMYVDIAHPVVRQHDEAGIVKTDTVFTNLRVRRTIALDSVCFPPPPAIPIICDYYYDTTYETLLVWKRLNFGEDKVALLWSALPFAADEYLPNLIYTADSMPLSHFSAAEEIDVWRWGAITSQPAGVADDWWLQGGMLSPDNGHTPFEPNWVAIDSTPRRMHVLDPNYATGTAPWNLCQPMWYYNSQSYSARGWTRRVIATVPGVVCTVPSGSRADVYACGRFDTGNWVVEFRRARKTGSSDDIQL
jgi:hypothetical protein